MSVVPYRFDLAHSSIGFTARHLVVSKVSGAFRKWSGTLSIDESDFTRSLVEVHIDAASIDTQNTERDEHLRSPDFFDAPQFPELVFKSSGVERVTDEHYRVFGGLTIRGITRRVALDAELNGKVWSPWGDQRSSFSAKVSIDRRSWGLVWNKAIEAGGFVVSDNIDINIEIQAVREAAPVVAAAKPAIIEARAG